MTNGRASEAVAPERRGFILVLGGVNVLFTAVEVLRAWPHPAGVGAHLVLTAILLVAPWLLGRPLSRHGVFAVVRTLGAGAALAFAAIAWAAGGTRGPYLAFLPMVPLIFTIAVPDDPWGSLLTGVAGTAAGLGLVSAEGVAPAEVAFWVLAHASTTGYGVAAAAFFVRQKAREARLETDRARAVETLTESERRRARAERLALVGRLAGGVAHDVANPLAAIRGNLAAIAERAGGRAGADPELAEALADTRAALDRIQRTVEDLRAFSREASGEPERCDVGALLGEALRLLRGRFDVAATVAVSVPSGLPAVRADPERLARALLWILADAADALDGVPPAGAARTVRVTARADGEEIAITFEDEGRDLDAARAFDPLGVGERGTGLALALAREDLVREGGTVEAARAPSGGARYVVRLPAAPPAGPAPEGPEPDDRTAERER